MATNEQIGSIAELMSRVDAMVRDVTAISMAIAKMERIASDALAGATLSRLSLACYEFVDRVQANRPPGF